MEYKEQKFEDALKPHKCQIQMTKKNYSKTLHKWQSKLHWKFNMFEL